jgi:hypothetical protein
MLLANSKIGAPTGGRVACRTRPRNIKINKRITIQKIIGQKYLYSFKILKIQLLIGYILEITLFQRIEPANL